MLERPKNYGYFDECNATDLLSKYSWILQEIYTGIFYPNWYIVNNHNNIIYRYTTPPRLLDQWIWKVKEVLRKNKKKLLE